MRMATLQIKDFPDELHKRAKRAALDDDESLRALVIAAVESEVEKRERKQRGPR